MKAILGAAILVGLVACSSGAVVDELAGSGGSGGTSPDAGELDAGRDAPACNPFVPHADASPDGCP